MNETALAVTQPSADADELQRVVERVLQMAVARGASQAEAAASAGAGLGVTVRLGEVETLEQTRDRGVAVTVYFGQRKATASTADFADAALEDTVGKACSIAGFTAEDPCAGLADRELMAVESPDLGLDHPWSLEPDAAIELARRCEAAALEADDRVDNSEGGSVHTSRGCRVYGNSWGFVGSGTSTRHSLSCSVLASSDGNMERDYWYSVARAPEHLESPEAVGLRAAQRTLRRLGARKIATTKAPVLLPPEHARGLIGSFLGALRGGAQYREASFLLDAAGEQVFPAFVQMMERPHLPGALASASFDQEGVATRDRDLLSDGVVMGYLLSSYSARKLGLHTTGHCGGAWNTLVPAATAEGEELDFEALLARMDRGFLVTELIGQGVNMVTGDYSRGAAGFWVEGGELRYPVHEVTIAGNLRAMFSGLQAIGTDVDRRGAVHCGSILLDEMTIAGD
ncbi:MAG: metalloprotease PmbA [Pseudomonadota bacterium]